MHNAPSVEYYISREIDTRTRATIYVKPAKLHCATRARDNYSRNKEKFAIASLPEFVFSSSSLKKRTRKKKRIIDDTIVNRSKELEIANYNKQRDASV